MDRTAGSLMLGAAALALLMSIPSPAAAGGLEDAIDAYLAAHPTPIPSYARQTGFACSACHYQFPALTPLGRAFKLGGYTLTTQPTLAEADATGGGRLELGQAPLFSGMLTSSVTHTRESVPDAQNDAVALPQEMSVFLGGRISSKIGMFSQLTYAGADGSIGIDNVDVRFASTTRIGSGPEVLYGVTLHDNPTIQDVWNTTPGWGLPFIGSDAALAGSAATLVDGGLAQSVLGLGGYALVGDLVYGELTLYRSAFQGSAAPSSATGAIQGVAPYWRVALQRAWGDRNVMVGTFGMRTKLYPDVLSGPVNQLTDVGVDAQFETRAGPGSLVARGAWIHENQTWSAGVASGAAANLDNTLETLRLNASYYYGQRLGFTAGFFQTTGSTDVLLYPAAPVTGSAAGDPETSGYFGQVDFNPWENARIGVQYTPYRRFNGLATDYDGSGRDASANDTLIVFLWLVI